MNFQIISGYSWWFAPLCLLAGFGYAMFLYYRNRTDEIAPQWRWWLFSFRFITVSLLAFLLLSPMVSLLIRDTEKPTIIIGVDNSRSMVMASDSIEQRKQLEQVVADLTRALSNDYHVSLYGLGQRISADPELNFNEGASDIGAFFTDMQSRYYNRNVGAMVLLSDGIYNVGIDPVYPARTAGFPVYSMKFGDTTVYCDLSIASVKHNQVAYKGNRFPIEAMVQAREAAGKSALITIKAGETEILSKSLDFVSNNQVIAVPAFAEASETGMLKLTVKIQVIEGETNTRNNERVVFVEVKEKRQKIALLANAPHPDLAAIERAVGQSNNFELEQFVSTGFNLNPAEYSLFVFHNLPSTTYSLEKLDNEIERLNKPCLYILGSQTDIQRFNGLRTGLSLINYSKQLNEAIPTVNEQFPLFTVSRQMINFLDQVPPLVAPFAQYKQSTASFTLAYQKIGNLKTDMPLLMFGQTAQRRIGVIAGEGIWKWRIFDYSLNNNHQAFDDLFGKIIQYLSVENDAGRLQVSWRNYYAENQPVEFSAIVYNESFEMITDPELQMVITDEAGKTYDYTFLTSGSGYQLNAGNLPPGSYRFTTTANTGSTTLQRQGSFSITALKLEEMNTVANHQLLNKLADETGGGAYFGNQAEVLIRDLKNRNDIKPVIYSRKQYTDLINFYPALILLILLLGAEWFLRKFYGNY
ncbi:MAG: hypothetical protein RBR28_02745 [Lentimicrobium sp.]|nr:hypothetical protein [Lentimicrobium sp.]